MTFAQLVDTVAETSGVCTDSRLVEPGAIFVALSGERFDGHDFAAEAIGRGARALVVERDIAIGDSIVSVVRVDDTRVAVSALAARYFGEPSKTLRILGITGTNGKTTTSYFVRAIFERAGIACGIIGTLGATLEDRVWSLDNTTPLALELHATLAAMRDAGARAVVMEVSSHALALERVRDVDFEVAALTNITRDHLDFHQTMEAYVAAKRKLFAHARYLVYNAQDEHGRKWATSDRRNGRAVSTFAIDEEASADVFVREFHSEDATGSVVTLNSGERLTVHLPGRYNVANALAALSIADAAGIERPLAIEALAECHDVPGRMQRVADGGVVAFIDYAHTPDALAHVLHSARALALGKLAVVFGCGGDRDVGKRPQMGRIAVDLADRVYITSDNPRSESAAAIAASIAREAPGAHVVLDRREAIELAIGQAGRGDIVVIAGKGHEKYQIVGTQRFAFDDVAVAQSALRVRATKVHA